MLKKKCRTFKNDMPLTLHEIFDYSVEYFKNDLPHFLSIYNHSWMQNYLLT